MMGSSRWCWRSRSPWWYVLCASVCFHARKAHDDCCSPGTEEGCRWNCSCAVYVHTCADSRHHSRSFRLGTERTISLRVYRGCVGVRVRAYGGTRTHIAIRAHAQLQQQIHVHVLRFSPTNSQEVQSSREVDASAPALSVDQLTHTCTHIRTYRHTTHHT